MGNQSRERRIQFGGVILYRALFFAVERKPKFIEYFETFTTFKPVKDKQQYTVRLQSERHFTKGIIAYGKKELLFISSFSGCCQRVKHFLGGFSEACLFPEKKNNTNSRLKRAFSSIVLVFFLL